MKIDCKIKRILEHRSGLTKEPKAWHIQPIEIEWQEPRTKSDGTIYAIDNTLVVDIAGDMAANFTLQVGQAITVDIRFSTTEWGNKTLNNIRSTFILLR